MWLYIPIIGDSEVHRHISQDGRSALIAALQNELMDVATALIQQGADINSVDKVLGLILQ